VQDCGVEQFTVTIRHGLEGSRKAASRTHILGRDRSAGCDDDLEIAVHGRFGRIRRMTRHCWKCGTEWTLAAPPGRLDTCLKCGSDLKVCLNCVSYAPWMAEQCRDGRAEQVTDKHLSNFCEWFDFARRDFTPSTQRNPREDSARAQLRKLLGD
jgi:hypothetical protein